MTPAAVGHMTPVELHVMLEGVDWVSDREWERAVFLRTPDPKAARDLLEYSYPHFRTDHVVKIMRPNEDEAPRRKAMSRRR